MKLLHTSDLHLGAKWGAESRAEDQARVLGELLDVAERENIDVLLVTGDVFNDRVEGSTVREAQRLLDRLAPHLRRGRPVVLLRGNHDQLAFFTLLGTLVKEMGGAHWPLVIADVPRVYPVPGQALQIVALPYVSPGQLQAQPVERELSPEERTAGLAGLLALQVEQLYRQADERVPAVFAGHILISGAKLTEDLTVESGYHRELWLEPKSLPRFTSYNALGHIHLSQEVRGVGKPTWYAGAPDRLDVGERDYSPQVLLVTVPDAPGGSADVELVPLTTCTPFVVEELTGEDGVDAFSRHCATANWPCTPLGRVTVAEVAPGQRGLVEARLREAAPRVEIRWAMAPVETGVPVQEEFDPHDVPAVVGGFLTRHFDSQPDRQARLRAGFEALWSEEVRS